MFEGPSLRVRSVAVDNDNDRSVAEDKKNIVDINGRSPPGVWQKTITEWK